MTAPTAGAVVIDNSPLLASIISDVLSELDGLTVLGTAARGSEGLELVRDLRPDIVLTEIMLDDIAGTDMIRKLKAIHPCQVVVVSSLCRRRTDSALRATQAGAFGFVPKGKLEPGPDGFEARLQRAVAAALTSIAGPTPTDRGGETTALEAPRVRAPLMLCVTASTGGPTALIEMLSALERPLPIPVLVVQHMPEAFLPALAERLDKAGPMPVRLPVHGERLRPGLVLVAPGDRHLVVGARRVWLVDAPRIGGLRPRGDLTFSSAAEHHGAGVLGVVLTGMGDDGLAGARAIVERGGQVIVQDQHSSIVDGMPARVREEGLALWSASPPELARAIEESVASCAGTYSRRSA